MENLLIKIAEYTVNGSPGVSQLIELQEIAKKAGVSRSKLDQMIKERVENSTNKDIPLEASEDFTKEERYSRLNFDSVRNSFDEEMEKRRELSSNYDRPEISFEKKEIVFPELNVTFNKTKEEAGSDDPEPEVKEKIGAIINDLRENISEEEMEEISFEEDESTVISKDVDSELRKRGEMLDVNVHDIRQRIYQSATREDLQRELFTLSQLVENYEVETDAAKILKVEINTKLTELLAGEKIANQQKEAQFKIELYFIREKIYELQTIDDVRREIKSLRSLVARYGLVTDLSRQIEKELLEREGLFQSGRISKEKIVEAQKILENKRKQIKQQKKNVYSPVKTEMKEANTSFVTSIIAVVVSLLFGYMGAFVAIYSLSSVSKANKLSKIAPGYSKKVNDKIKNAKIISIVALIIGGLKLIRFIYFTYFGYYYYY